MVRFLKGGGTLLLPMVVLLGLSGLSGCGSGGRPAGPATGPAGADLEQAQRLYGKLVREHSLHRDAEALAAAGALLEQYPTFSPGDEVLFLAFDSSARLGRAPEALDLADRLLTRFPVSVRVEAALTQAADLAAAGGDSLRAAGYYVSLYDRDPAGRTGPDGRPRAAAFLAGLDLDGLTALASQRPDSALRPYLDFLRVERLMAGGRSDAAAEVVGALKARAPGNVWTVASQNVLSGAPGIIRPGFVGAVRDSVVGVVCPLTGRYAVLGNAFYDAALLAAEVTNAELGTSFDLEVGDSGGDPVAVPWPPGACAGKRAAWPCWAP